MMPTELEPWTLIALLGRSDEGRAFLDQLGVDLQPTLSPEEVSRLAREFSGATADPPSAELEFLIETLVAAQARVTFGADLDPRLSIVGFLADQTAITIVMSAASALMVAVTRDALRGQILEMIVESEKQNVRWWINNWVGAERVIAVAQSGAGSELDACDFQLADRARNLESLPELVDLVIDPGLRSSK